MYLLICARAAYENHDEDGSLSDQLENLAQFDLAIKRCNSKTQASPAAANLFKNGLVSVEPLAFLEGIASLVVAPEFILLLSLAGITLGAYAVWVNCAGGA